MPEPLQPFGADLRALFDAWDGRTAAEVASVAPEVASAINSMLRSRWMLGAAEAASESARDVPEPPASREDAGLGYDLVSLKAAGEVALDTALRNPDVKKWGVFRPHASVVCAVRAVDHDGDVVYLVELDGVSPNDQHVREAVSAYLESHSFPGVHVRAEW